MKIWSVICLASSVIAETIYDFSVKNAKGEDVSLEKYDNGKVTLIVNVASKCGYTDQYAELVELQERYKEDLQILAFPCNDFEGQEPGEIGEILEFAKEKYDTNFEIFDKIKQNSFSKSKFVSRTKSI